jgi:initiation factor 1A
MNKFTTKSGVRIAEDGESYGIVTKHLGNGQLMIKLKGSGERICKIRGKFNKKNKDKINVGTWVLVAEQSYATKQTHCDLLEIYTQQEVKKLRDMRNDWPSEFTGEENTNDEEYTDVHVLENDNTVVMDIDFDEI